MLPPAVLPAALGLAVTLEYLHHLAQVTPPSVPVTVLALALSLRKGTPVRTTLESGAWIEHVPIQGLTARQYRDWARLSPNISEDAVDDDGQVDVRAIVAGMDIGLANLDKTNALFGILISAWSYELPVPVFDRPSGETSNVEALEEIPGEDYREIFLLLQPFREKLDIKVSPKEVTTSGSNGSSKGRANGSRRA